MFSQHYIAVLSQSVLSSQYVYTRDQVYPLTQALHRLCHASLDLVVVLVVLAYRFQHWPAVAWLILSHSDVMWAANHALHVMVSYTDICVWN